MLFANQGGNKMRPNILYFPYIRVPESPWFTRMLLYWDQVASIIPYEFIYDPDRLGEHTRSLVEHELVRQVHPEQYIEDIPSFSSSFETYLQESHDRLVKRREAFQRDETFRIHMEKMGPIEEVLCEYGLARIQDYPLFSVEKDTAMDFMAYLAACLGRLEDIDADPVSDARANLMPLTGHDSHTMPHDEEIDVLRWVVLEELFPAPERALKAEEIADFRAKYKEILREFRRRVEREILALVELNDMGHRERRMELFREEIHDSVVEIRKRLEESGAGKTLLSKVYSVALVVPGIPPLVGLLNAIGQAFKGSNRELRPLPLAYAAHAQVDLLDENK